ASNGITLAPSSVLQVEVYGRQWNITLPSPSAAVQLLIVLACLASQLLLFGDILYQLLMLAITFVVQGLMLFFLHSGLHLRQRAASGYQDGPQVLLYARNRKGTRASRESARTNLENTFAAETGAIEIGDSAVETLFRKGSSR
ncbi:hypothetical protein FOZ62_015761, partial [Perkinsus olseni]